MLGRLQWAPYALLAWAHSLRAERAQTLAEYSLILSLIAVGVVVPSMILFRGALIDAFESASSCMLGSC